MKKIYESPVAEVIDFAAEERIAANLGDGLTGELTITQDRSGVSGTF